tara:strand:- start:2677 stop:2871 length:195 start_codon:yes stop_codon:yes gene_type:complete
MGIDLSRNGSFVGKDCVETQREARPKVSRKVNDVQVVKVLPKVKRSLTTRTGETQLRINIGRAQ